MNLFVFLYFDRIFCFIMIVRMVVIVNIILLGLCWSLSLRELYVKYND